MQTDVFGIDFLGVVGCFAAEVTDHVVAYCGGDSNSNVDSQLWPHWLNHVHCL